MGADPEAMHTLAPPAKEHVLLPIKGRNLGFETVLAVDSDDVDINDSGPGATPLSSVPGNMSPIRSLRFSKHGVQRGRRFISQGAEALEQHGDINALYEVGHKLGEGGFGTVYEVKCRKTGRKFALKTVRTREDRGNGDVEAEISSSREFDHPYVVKLHGFFREDARYHLIMDLCSGGDLRDRVVQHVNTMRQFTLGYNSGLPPKLGAKYTWQMLNGLTFLHHHGFIHRDIKPENYLLESAAEDSPVKLADFGFACRISRTEKLKRMVGTVNYAAPELLAGEPYDQRADVWSLGVTCFGICTDRLPFAGDSEQSYACSVRAGKLEECPAAWAQHFSKLLALVLLMLTHNPAARPSAKVLLANNAWLRKYGKNNDQECCVIG